MILDCDTCTMRDVACGDCVVTALLGPIDISVNRGVLDALADAGLVKPLRLISSPTTREHDKDERATG